MPPVVALNSVKKEMETVPHLSLRPARWPSKAPASSTVSVAAGVKRTAKKYMTKQRKHIAHSNGLKEYCNAYVIFFISPAAFAILSRRIARTTRINRKSRKD